jgi:hypothetical protein
VRSGLVRPWRWLAPIALAVVTQGPVEAHAQSGQELAMAEALFQEARQLMEAGELDRACPKFAKSLELDDKLGTELNLAVCHQRQGKTATAWAEFTAARSRAQQEQRRHRADFAAARIEELSVKLSYLVIQASSGTTVMLDAKPVSAVMFDTKLPVDPGPHVLEATAEAKKPWRKEFEVAPGPVELPIVVPLLEDAPAPAPVALDAPAAPPPAPSPAPVPPDSGGGVDGATIAAATGFAVGGVGLVIGAIVGGITLSKGSELKDACLNDICPPDRQSDIDSATTLANVSNAMFVIGGVGVAVGVVGLVLMGGDDEGTASLTFELGPTAAGLRGRF